MVDFLGGVTLGVNLPSPTFRLPLIVHGDQSRTAPAGGRRGEWDGVGWIGGMRGAEGREPSAPDCQSTVIAPRRRQLTARRRSFWPP